MHWFLDAGQQPDLSGGCNRVRARLGRSDLPGFSAALADQVHVNDGCRAGVLVRVCRGALQPPAFPAARAAGHHFWDPARAHSESCALRAAAFPLERLHLLAAHLLQVPDWCLTGQSVAVAAVVWGILPGHARCQQTSKALMAAMFSSKLE